MKLRCNANVYKIYQRAVGKTVHIVRKRHKTAHKTSTTTPLPTTTSLPEIEELDYVGTTDGDSSLWSFMGNCTESINKR